MASRTLNVTITGDARSLNRALGSVESQTGKVESRMTKFSSIAKGALAGAAVGGTVLLVKGLSDSVKAAAEAEKSQARLTAQLRAQGISYRANASEIDRVIQKTSQLAGLDDEDLQDAFTNIVRVTGDVSKSLRLTGLAADFARAKHLDVAKAGEIVGKVAGGNTGILSRYGIQIEKGATATEALGKLQQKFAGQAAAYGRTTAGAQDRFRVAVENLQETIGKKLTPVLARAFNSAARFINQMQAGTGAGGRFAKSVNEIANALRPMYALAARVGAGVASNMDKIATAVKIATVPSRAFLSVMEKVASVELSVARGAISVGKALGGGLASAANSVAGAFRGVAQAVQSVLDKVNALLERIPHIKFPKIPFISSAGGTARRPDSTPGPSLQTQINFATSDVELAQTEFVPDLRVKAQQHRQKLIASRLNQLRKRKGAVVKALNKKGLKPKTRHLFIQEELALIQEEAALVAELNGIAGDIASSGADAGSEASTESLATADTSFDAGSVGADASVTTVTAPDNSAAELATAMRELTDAIDKQNAHADAVRSIGMAAAMKALSDVVSGQIAGYGGYAGRAATAGAGSTFRL